MSSFIRSLVVETLLLQKWKVNSLVASNTEDDPVLGHCDRGLASLSETGSSVPPPSCPSAPVVTHPQKGRHSEVILSPPSLDTLLSITTAGGNKNLIFVNFAQVKDSWG